MHRYNKLPILLIVLVGIAIPACSSDGNAPIFRDEVLVIWADEATAPDVQLLLNTFETEHPEYQVTMSVSSTDDMRNVFAEQDSSAAITIIAPQVTDFAVPIAFETLVLISGSGKGAGLSLDSAEVKGIIAGSISNWNEISEVSGNLTLVTYQDGHPIRQALEQWAGSGFPVSSEARIVSSFREMEAALRADPNALGITIGSEVADGFTVLSVDEIPPFVDEQPNNRYPIQMPIYYLDDSEPTGGLAVLLEWILSDRGKDVLSNDLIVP